MITVTPLPPSAFLLLVLSPCLLGIDTPTPLVFLPLGLLPCFSCWFSLLIPKGIVARRRTPAPDKSLGAVVSRRAPCCRAKSWGGGPLSCKVVHFCSLCKIWSFQSRSQLPLGISCDQRVLSGSRGQRGNSEISSPSVGRDWHAGQANSTMLMEGARLP